VHQKAAANPVDEVIVSLQVYKMAGTENEPLSHIKSHKLRFCGHAMRQPHDNSEGSVLSGIVEGVRRRGRPKICWFVLVV